MTSEQESAALSKSQLAAIDIADWDRLADAYAAAIGGPEDRIYTMLRGGLWSSLGADVSGLDVLDLGCGHGWLSALLAAKGARVRGIDGSVVLLEHARRIAPTVEFARYDLVGDALRVDKEYDRIVAHMVLPAQPELKARAEVASCPAYCFCDDGGTIPLILK